MLLELILSGPDWTWLVTAVIAILTVVTVKHFLFVRSLPPGPFPLPLVGNMLSFIGKDITPHKCVEAWRQKYGNLFTVWLGPKPTIMVCGWELCRENLVVKRNEYSGRMSRRSLQLLLHESEDIIFGDFGPCWETLRKIMALAIRKYSVSESLPELVAPIVDDVIEIMLKEDNALDPNDYLYLCLYNVLASSVVGRKFEIDDQEFIDLRDSNEKMNDAFDQGLVSDAIPFLSFLYQKRENAIRDTSFVFRQFFEKEYRKHQESYRKGVLRDFMDAVIAARDEAQEESKEALQFLNEKNIVSVNVDLFTAGTDTTRLSLNWILLFVANDPTIQKRMQEEIDEQIGSRIPVQKDRDTCPYVYAVITEMLRLRPILDISLEHKSTCDSEIDGYKIPKDTSVMFHLASSHRNEEIWPEPNVFKPERFLEPSGRFTSSRKIGYLPFGLGRRSCPGEKLALVDIFLILARLVQKIHVELETGPGTANFDYKVQAFTSLPEPYKLIVKRREIS